MKPLFERDPRETKQEVDFKQERMWIRREYDIHERLARLRDLQQRVELIYGKRRQERYSPLIVNMATLGALAGITVGVIVAPLLTPVAGALLVAGATLAGYLGAKRTTRAFVERHRLRDQYGSMRHGLFVQRFENSLTRGIRSAERGIRLRERFRQAAIRGKHQKGVAPKVVKVARRLGRGKFDL